MGKARDHFKRIRDTKETFHEWMDTFKDRNDMDLTEEEDIKKSWHEYTERLSKKDLFFFSISTTHILFIYFFPFIFICWRLITLQYCSVFCHTLT